MKNVIVKDWSRLRVAIGDRKDKNKKKNDGFADGNDLHKKEGKRNQ